MNLREFVARSAGALAGWTIESLLPLGPMLGQETSKRTRIAVSTWSFRNFFPSTRDEIALPGSTKYL
jgi:hypothetical protein